MTALSSYYLLIKSLTKEFKYLRVETKKSKWYWRLLREALYLLSFHQWDFYKLPTSIGTLFLLPDEWGEQTLASHHQALLRHQQYIRLYRNYGLGNLWFGTVVYAAIYPVIYLIKHIKERL